MSGLNKPEVCFMSDVGLRMLKAVVFKRNTSLKNFIFVNLGFNYQNYKKILLLTLKNSCVYWQKFCFLPKNRLSFSWHFLTYPKKMLEVSVNQPSKIKLSNINTNKSKTYFRFYFISKIFNILLIRSP